MVRILAFTDPHSTESEKGRHWKCRHGLELLQLENITDSDRERPLLLFLFSEIDFVFLAEASLTCTVG